jgi:hypothetical protein
VLAFLDQIQFKGIHPTMYNFIFYKHPDTFVVKKIMDKKEKMFSLVDQWRKSGLMRKSFAAQHGLTDSSFEYWCRKHDNKVKQQPIIKPDFVELIPKHEFIPNVNIKESNLHNWIFFVIIGL